LIERNFQLVSMNFTKKCGAEARRSGWFGNKPLAELGVICVDDAGRRILNHRPKK
jgi:hypothetical protein